MAERTEQRAPREPGAGFQLGRIAGIPLFATPWWFLSAILLTVLLAPRFELEILGVRDGGGYAVAGAFVLALYLSVLAHELSHALVARRFGLPVRRITLHLLGGQTEMEESQSPGKQAVIAVAGPATSLMIGGVSLLLHHTVTEPSSIPWALTFAVGAGNVFVGAFNLLPGLPLDGGQIVRSAVWRITGRPSAGLRAASHAGRAIAVVAVIGGLYLAASSRPFNLMTVLVGALLGGFMWAGASQGLLTATLRERVATLDVRALTRRAIPVAAATPLSEAVRQARVSGAGAIVVVDPDGAPHALVSEATVRATPDHRRPWLVVADVAKVLVDGMRVELGLDGERLVRFMHANPATEYLVVEPGPGGQVYGVLAARDVERALASL